MAKWNVPIHSKIAVDKRTSWEDSRQSVVAEMRVLKSDSR